jgi:hypothetical protein
MELEITYEDFLKYYPPIKTDFTKFIPKVICKLSKIK